MRPSFSISFLTIFSILTTTQAQVFPNNSHHALPLPYPLGCQHYTGNKTTRTITPRPNGQQYCTTVGSNCTTSKECVAIAQDEKTRLCASRQGGEFAQCVDGSCRMKEQTELYVACDCLQGCQQGLGDYRSCFWPGECVQCIPCGLTSNAQRPCCPPGVYKKGVCSCKT